MAAKLGLAILFFSIATQDISATDNDPSLIYTSYQTLPICTPATPFQNPQSISDLQALIWQALLDHKTLKPLGSRHSATDIICTDGSPISMSAFNTTVMNSDGTATFGSGLSLGAALQFLQANGRTLAVVPQFMGITLGGALGTGAHGSSLKHPAALSDQIVKMTVLDGNGILRKISGHELDVFRVHLGLLGFVIDVTFETVEAFKLTVSVVPYPDSILEDGTLLEMARNSDYFVAQWYHQRNQVLVTTGTQVPMSTPGNAFQNLYPPSPIAVTGAISQLSDFVSGRRNLAGGFALEEFSERSFYQQVIGRLPYFTENYLTMLNPATGLGWQLTSAICNEVPNGCSWRNGNYSVYFDEEGIACDLAEFSEIVRTLKAILTSYPATFTFGGVTMRFQKKSKATLYMAAGH